ncbi:Uma2 family endonuclease [Streptomyces erythrochromogenes]|uniref:Uma2 family endonuclease n=1 Tax=Streptomyces erythrochromogenes TaxID=285574 RepID=UPI00367D1327
MPFFAAPSAVSVDRPVDHAGVFCPGCGHLSRSRLGRGGPRGGAVGRRGLCAGVADTDESGVAVSARHVLAVVEIASPSTRVTYRKLRPSLYAAAGIEHYWRIELEPAPRLLIGHLRNGAYADLPPLLAGAVAAIHQPFPIDIDPAAWSSDPT